MKLKRFEIALIFAVFAVFVCGFGAKRDAEALSGKLVRLHVVANSDSEADQALKLKVRDAVLSELRPRLEGVSDAGTAREIIEENADQITAAAERAISREGGCFRVETSLCRESFPTTEYDTFTLPAGEYLSLRVRIGEAAGHNWWCVVFPPICDAGQIDADTAAAIGLTDDEVKLITSDSAGYVVKFRIIELINQLFELLR